MGTAKKLSAASSKGIAGVSAPKVSSCSSESSSASSRLAGWSESSDLARRQIAEIIDNERMMRENCNRAEWVIQRITRFSGSVSFISLHAAWFIFWIGLNLMLPSRLRWDPFPFTFLTLVVSLEAIFLSTFILVTENREAAVAERRMHLDLQINLMAEKENTRMFALLREIADHLGVHPAEDPESRALAKETQPSRILDLIDECLKASDPTVATARKFKK